MAGSRPDPERHGGAPRREMRGRNLADVSEDQLLAVIFPVYAGAAGGSHAGVRLGPGDDTALLRVDEEGVLATTDTMVRGTDWLDEWSSARDVGAKCVAQNLADIAAMGGVPTGLLVTFVADPATSLAWVVDLAAGIAEAAGDGGTVVVGGDLSGAPPGVLLVSITALGVLEGREPVTRAGARVGDLVAVAGSLGRSAAGLSLLTEGGPERAPDLVGAHLRPRPPYEQGPRAASAGATAMIDLSDGLVRDAGRLAAASRVRVDLQMSGLADDIAALADAVGPKRARDCVLGGGEEHSLLATFADRSALPEGWRVIGVVADGADVTVDGQPPATRSWDHFMS